MSSEASDVNCTTHWQGTGPPAWLASHWGMMSLQPPVMSCFKTSSPFFYIKYPTLRKEIEGSSNIPSH